VPRFRKKPVVVEAVLWTGHNLYEVLAFCPGSALVGSDGGLLSGTKLIHVPTIDNYGYADVGDYIIKGVQGEFYPCKPDIFHATYEPE
jgi:hypothetical protein